MASSSKRLDSLRRGITEVVDGNDFEATQAFLPVLVDNPNEAPKFLYAFSWRVDAEEYVVTTNTTPVQISTDDEEYIAGDYILLYKTTATPLTDQVAKDISELYSFANGASLFTGYHKAYAFLDDRFVIGGYALRSNTFRGTASGKTFDFDNGNISVTSGEAQETTEGVVFPINFREGVSILWIDYLDTKVVIGTSIGELSVDALHRESLLAGIFNRRKGASNFPPVVALGNTYQIDVDGVTILYSRYSEEYRNQRYLDVSSHLDEDILNRAIESFSGSLEVPFVCFATNNQVWLGLVFNEQEEVAWIRIDIRGKPINSAKLIGQYLYYATDTIGRIPLGQGAPLEAGALNYVELLRPYIYTMFGKESDNDKNPNSMAIENLRVFGRFKKPPLLLKANNATVQKGVTDGVSSEFGSQNTEDPQGSIKISLGDGEDALNAVVFDVGD